MPVVQIVVSKPKMLIFGATKLRPGVNAVDSKIAAEMKKHPHIQKLIAAGKLSISNGPPATKGLKIEEAQKLVSETHDPDLLRAYAKKEDRAVVARAIEEKIETSGPTAVKPGE